MSALSDSIKSLLQFLDKEGLKPPTAAARVVEATRDTRADARGRLQIRREDLHTPEEYKQRFDELLSAGLPWINVSCYGVYEGALVIVIEASKSRRRSRRTSINYSGPAASVVENGWNVNTMVTIA